MDILLLILVSIILIEVSYLLLTNSKNQIQHIGKRKVFIDTSALMDGRIVTAAQTGFIPDTLIVPESVIAELQLLADQADNEKRMRARRGLDAVKELQNIEGVSVVIVADGPTGEGGVDARLIELAKKQSGSQLCTIDFNLNKVAQVNDIHVLNINELAGSIRMAFLPGETMNLTLTQKGQGDNQAVGYLADGTMVVVDRAAKQVGANVQIEFIRSLQTAAGRMMFAKLVGVKSNEKSSVRAVATSNDLSNDNKKSKTDKTKGRRVITKTDTQTSADEERSKPTTTKRRTRKSATENREESLIELVNSQD
jgi:uncharacterized protein YacL